MKKYKIDQIIENIGTKSYEDIKNKKIRDKINILRTNKLINKLLNFLGILFFIISYFTIKNELIFGTFILFLFILAICFLNLGLKVQNNLLKDDIDDFISNK